MSKPRYVLLALLCVGLLGAVSAAAVATKPAQGESGAGNGPPVSPEVRQMLHEVSAQNIERSIRRLVAFGTRHTLSTQTDPNRGSERRATGSTASSSSTQPHPAVG